MIFKCKNCGGNTIYSPERHGMFCPFCESENSAERNDGDPGPLNVCPNCGSEIVIQEHTSATRCPGCDCYLILDERVEGEYAPKTILPFQLGKEVCKQSLREKFKKCRFAPVDFLSEARLNEIQGIYVPYWFYDYDTRWVFQGEGTKIRSWTSGDTAYTETSIYDVQRDMDISFQGIPVDASEQMPDDVMELVAPFQYDQVTDFKPEYMSGFYAEKYNMASDAVEERAKKIMRDASARLCQNTYSGSYSSVKTLHDELKTLDSHISYGLLPVWIYRYRYKGQEYPFYVNGQTGKIVGNPPVSTRKVWAYAGTLWASLTAILVLLQLIAGCFFW